MEHVVYIYKNLVVFVNFLLWTFVYEFIISFMQLGIERNDIIYLFGCICKVNTYLLNTQGYLFMDLLRFAIKLASV